MIERARRLRVSGDWDWECVSFEVGGFDVEVEVDGGCDHCCLWVACWRDGVRWEVCLDSEGGWSARLGACDRGGVSGCRCRTERLSVLDCVSTDLSSCVYVETPQ